MRQPPALTTGPVDSPGRRTHDRVDQQLLVRVASGPCSRLNLRHCETVGGLHQAIWRRLGPSFSRCRL
eukprot:795688-Heterocapsa_arctica.AAC.1